MKQKYFEIIERGSGKAN